MKKRQKPETKKNKGLKQKGSEQVTLLQEKINQLKSQLSRALADYENLQKRTEREGREIESRLKSRIFARVAYSLDLFYDVQNHLKDTGLSMAIGELENSLKEESIVKIKVGLGDKFDERVHEAVEAEETAEKNKKGTIKEIVQTGWRIADGPVIRHAKVVVYK